MPDLLFLQLAGGSEIPAMPGESILSAMRAAGQHIFSVCGGRGMCGTCRVAVDGKFFDLLPAPKLAETRLLHVLKAGAPHHRLACQTILNASHDGLVFNPDPPPSKMLLQEKNP
jgi:ferredoxin